MRTFLSVFFILMTAIFLSSPGLATDRTKCPLVKGVSKAKVTNDVHGRGTPSDLPPVGTRNSNGLDEVIISEDFEAYAAGELPPGWIQIDEDGGFSGQFNRESTWQTFSLGAGDAHSGSNFAMCHYNDDAVPNQDWLIIPAGILEAPINFSYWRSSQDPNFVDSYELRISTTGMNPADFTDLITDEDDIPVAWEQRSFDLSAYAGAPFYIAFYYNSVDKFMLKVDDVLLEGTPSSSARGALTGIVRRMGTNVPLEDVTVSVLGTLSMGTTDVSGNYLIENIPVGSYTVRFTKDGYDPVELLNVIIEEDETTVRFVLMLETIEPPLVDNDDCDDPFVIDDVGIFPFTTLNATSDPTVAELPAECDEGAGVDFAPDVWASWIAPSFGFATFSTCNDADFDTRMACYTLGYSQCPSCPTTNDILHACNDDADGCSGFTSELTFSTIPGVCYLVRIGGYSVAVGTGNLTVSFEESQSPVLEIAPDSLAFGGVEVDSTSELILVATNLSTFPILIQSITAPEGFTVDPTALAIPSGPSASRNLSVTFAPTAAQSYSGYITITSNDPDSPHLIPVSGEGITVPSCEPLPQTVDIDPTDPLPICECLFICPDIATPIFVGPGLGPDQQPTFTLSEGCLDQAVPAQGCSYVPECPPATPYLSSWSYIPPIGAWVTSISAAPGTAAGCVCLCIDGYLPVELSSFDAVAGDRSVTLNWTTASETNNDHFDIVRNGTLVAQINAQNSATGNHYSWTERNLNNGREYTYTLIAVSQNGTREEMATASATPTVTAATITEYALHQNYPNPFNPETQISFDIAEAVTVKLGVYNLLGQQVASLVNGPMAPGRHSVTFLAADLPSGMYLYRLEAGEFVAQHKMVLMK